MAEATAPQGFWRTRYTVIAMCFLATFVCYIDRVNISVAIIPMSSEFAWSATTQGTVLSSFFIGYLLMQIVGGRLADRFGGKVVLAFGVLLWSLFTIITPPAAWLGFALLIIVRIGMGMGEAVTFPSIYSLVSRWIPNTERSMALSVNAVGIPVGTVFALLVTPIIVQGWGWEWAFYTFGAVGIFWFVLWQRLVTTRPDDHPRISDEERDYINQTAPVVGEAAVRPSWGKLLTNMPLWAIIVAHFANNWTLYVILSWLPKYVNEGLGVDFASIGYVSMLPHLAPMAGLLTMGYFSDRLLARVKNVTRLRKVMQTIAFGGLAACLLGVAEVTSATAAIGLMCLGKIFGSFGMGGHSVNHLDIGPRHAGTLMGITNTAGTIPGIIGVYVTGLILDATNSWALVFQVTAGVTLFGMVFYAIFASGEKQFD